MQMFLHFLFTQSQPGVFKAQKITNSPFQKFKLLVFLCMGKTPHRFITCFQFPEIHDHNRNDATQYPLPLRVWDQARSAPNGPNLDFTPHTTFQTIIPTSNAHYPRKIKVPSSRLGCSFYRTLILVSVLILSVSACA